MKEAAGEANMTVITIVLIAIVLAVGTVIVKNLMDNTAKKSACNSLNGTLDGNKCSFTIKNGQSRNCTLKKCSGGGYSCSIEGANQPLVQCKS